VGEANRSVIVGTRSYASVPTDPRRNKVAPVVPTNGMCGKSHDWDVSLGSGATPTKRWLKSRSLMLKQFDHQRFAKLLALGRFGRIRTEKFEAPGAQLRREVRAWNRVRSSSRTICCKTFLARSATLRTELLVARRGLFFRRFGRCFFSSHVSSARLFVRIGHFRLFRFATSKRKKGQGNERRGERAGQVLHERYSTGSFVRTQGAVFRRSFEQTTALCHARPPCMCISLELPGLEWVLLPGCSRRAGMMFPGRMSLFIPRWARRSNAGAFASWPDSIPNIWFLDQTS
jgi:hypothetical protein